MTTTGTDRTGPYHHGSVEAAAVAAATELVRTSGAAALTVRAVAASIGVTHAALYRHIDSRAVLLDRVAARWIDIATDRIDGATSYAVVIDRYVRWALESESLYRCAFEPGSSVAATAPATPAALDRLRIAVAASYRNDLGGTGDDVRDGVFATWGQAHGLVDLYWKGLLRAADPHPAATYIARLVVVPARTVASES